MKIIKYLGTFIGSLFGLALIIIPVIMTIYNLNSLTTVGIVIISLCCALGFGLIKIMEPVRAELLQQMETDSYGRKKKGYKHLSEKDRKIIDLYTAMENERALSDNDYRNMLKSGSKNPEQDMNKLIGLDNVKQKILELKAQMQYVDKKERKTFHVCFLGNPGTGKTTVAKIITGFLYQYKFIKKNEVICTDAASIMSSSNPVRRMQLILSKAHNKVLFIDEAYAFIYDRTGVGQETLAVLLNLMELERDSLTVIFAGYRKEMKMLFEMNSGLKSRINTYIFFEDYNVEEMYQIYESLAKDKNFTVSHSAMVKLKAMFIGLKNLDSFANARTVRTIFENSVNKHYFNLSQGLLSGEDKFIIQGMDIENNSEELKYFKETRQKSH